MMSSISGRFFAVQYLQNLWEIPFKIIQELSLATANSISANESTHPVVIFYPVFCMAAHTQLDFRVRVSAEVELLRV